MQRRLFLTVCMKQGYTKSPFVGACLAGDNSSRRSQTGVLIFMNKDPIRWYSDRQETVETSTFGEEFCAVKEYLEIVETLCYNLQVFGVPVYGSSNVFYDK